MSTSAERSSGNRNLEILLGMLLLPVVHTLGAAAQQSPGPLFTDVTSQVGMGGSPGGIGLAWADYDRDGDQDLFVGNANGPNNLYRNDGGVFVDVIEQSGLQDPGVTTGTAWGDCDGDGALDLYMPKHWGQPNRLFRNDGTGHFEDVTAGAGAGVGNPGSTIQAAWADYDSDGILDLLISNEGGDRSHLFRGNGNCSFVDVTHQVGADLAFGSGRGISWGDYDNDGHTDLFAAAVDRSYLYQNQGNGTFVDVTFSASPGLAASGISPSWGDQDNDGYLDLFLSGHGPSFMFRNNRDGTFTDITGQLAGKAPGDGRGTAWGDYNNDSHQDLFLAYPGPNRLLRNNGDGNWHDATAEAGQGVGSGGNTHPATWVDYDLDGYLDLCFADANIGASERLFLFRNNAVEGGNHLAVQTTGIVSNRWGVGAKVTLMAGNVTQTREVQTSSGYTSQSGTRLFFGMDGWSTVEALSVVWPSGLRQDYANLPANQLLSLVEPTPPPIEPNSPPVAAPGPDQIVPASGACGAQVSFDGTASFDPDGDPLTYRWSSSRSFIAWSDSLSATPVGQVPVGTHTVVLTVADGQYWAVDSTRVTVFDSDLVPPLPELLAGSRIAFQANPADGTNYDIYAFNANGTSLVNLTHHPAIDAVPSWSPDGSRIAFESNRDGPRKLHVMDANGDNLHPVAPDTVMMSYSDQIWHPSGDTLAFVSLRDGNAEIYAIALSSGQPTRITTHPASDVEPSWNPVTGSMAFTSWRSGNSDIWLMEGTDLRQLTLFSGNDFNPSWSSDGTRIAYMSEQDGSGEIYIMNADGSGKTRLTCHPGQDWHPAWSPDDTRIVFMSDRDAQLVGGWDLYMMSSDGSHVERLTDAPGTAGLPAWAPFPPPLAVTAFSPVDLRLLDPQGRSIERTPGGVVGSIPGATYTEADVNGDGDPDDRVQIPAPVPGPYQIVVTPEPGASPSDTYSLTAEQRGHVVTLVNHARVPTSPAPVHLPLPLPPNFPPVAEAGADTVTSCTACLTEVTLDGSRSFDPDGGVLRFHWWAPPARYDDSTRTRFTAAFPIGRTQVGLRVYDPAGWAGQDSLFVTVLDTIAPDVQVTWPTSSDTFLASDTIAVRYLATDNCDDSLQVQIWPPPPLLPVLDLGRQSIVVVATDNAGNVSRDSVVVQVIPQVSLSAVQGFRGATTPMPLTADNLDGLVGATFHLTYDKDKLQIDEDGPHTTALTSGFVIDVDRSTGVGKALGKQPGNGQQGEGRGDNRVIQRPPIGRLAVGIASDTPLPQGSRGPLVKIPVQVKRTAAVSVGDVIPVTLTQATLVYDDGTLRTFHPALASGHLQVVAAGVAGDVNQSGGWDLEDVVLILRVIVDMTERLTPLQETLADADGNSTTDLRDAFAVLNGLVRAKLVPGPSPADPVAIDLPPAVASPMKRLSIPLRLRSRAGVYGLDAWLRYDPAAMQLEEILPRRTGALMVSNARIPGAIRLLALSQEDLASSPLPAADLVFTGLVAGPQQVYVHKAQALGADGAELPVDLGSGPGTPSAFMLMQNYPNPFNPETIIRYDLAERQDVRIRIYNLAGQRLETLDALYQQPGRHEVTWNTGGYAPGVYLLVIEAGQVRQTLKMVLVK